MTRDTMNTVDPPESSRLRWSAPTGSDRLTINRGPHAPPRPDPEADMSRTSERILERILELRGRAADGATSVEYAIIIAAIAGVIVLAVTAVGIKTGANFSKITDAWH